VEGNNHSSLIKGEKNERKERKRNREAFVCCSCLHQELKKKKPAFI
jgi:hypothetical protein